MGPTCWRRSRSSSCSPTILLKTTRAEPTPRSRSSTANCCCGRTRRCTASQIASGVTTCNWRARFSFFGRETRRCGGRILAGVHSSLHGQPADAGHLFVERASSAELTCHKQSSLEQPQTRNPLVPDRTPRTWQCWPPKTDTRITFVRAQNVSKLARLAGVQCQGLNFSTPARNPWHSIATGPRPRTLPIDHSVTSAWTSARSARESGHKDIAQFPRSSTRKYSKSGFGATGRSPARRSERPTTTRRGRSKKAASCQPSCRAPERSVRGARRAPAVTWTQSVFFFVTYWVL
jgi:hypothetical protein